jgi:CBS domain-containing protein
MTQATSRTSSFPIPSARFENVLVVDAMRPEVITCPADAPLRWVAGLMAAERVHCIVVEPPGVRGGRRAWGMVSDLDLVGAAGRDLDATTAAGVAASEFLTVTPGEKLERAAQVMAEHEAAHLVVVDPSSGRPIGVLSTFDVANVLARAEAFA